MEKFNDKKSRNLNFLKFIGSYVSDSNFENIRHCGNFLQFYADITKEKKKLKHAYFCKNRFCPFCAWRKSQKQALMISTIMRYLKDQDFEFIFLTLTSPNVIGDDLEDEIKRFSYSFTKLMKRKKVAGSILGYVRNLEITYNKNRDDFHPHLHVLLCVNKSYFTNSKKYISRDEWLKLWRESMKDSAITQVDVRKVNAASKKAIYELSKYTSKDEDYLVNKEVFDYFYTSLKGKNATTYGGLFKDAKKLYEANELEYLKDVDLTEYVYLITYIWGPSEYNLENIIELSDEEKQSINKKIDFLESIEKEL